MFPGEKTGLRCLAARPRLQSWYLCKPSIWFQVYLFPNSCSEPLCYSGLMFSVLSWNRLATHYFESLSQCCTLRSPALNRNKPVLWKQLISDDYYHTFVSTNASLFCFHWTQMKHLDTAEEEQPCTPSGWWNTRTLLLTVFLKTRSWIFRPLKPRRSVL